MTVYLKLAYFGMLQADFYFLDNSQKDVIQLICDTWKYNDLKENSTSWKVISEYHNKKTIARQSQINFWHKCVS